MQGRRVGEYRTCCRTTAVELALCLATRKKLAASQSGSSDVNSRTSNIRQQDPAGRALHLDKIKLHHKNGRQTTTRRNGRAREHRRLFANHVHVRRVPCGTRRAPRPPRAHHQSLERYYSFLQEDVRDGTISKSQFKANIIPSIFTLQR